MNDPDETMGLPIIELSSEPNGSSPRKAFTPKDTIIPPKDTIRSHAATGTDADPYRFEPTVFGAVRRYRVMVLAVGILVMLLAVAYAAKQPKVYQAEANLTVPVPVSAQNDSAEYLDSQVLLLQSQDVAQRAASIANSQLGSNSLNASAFSGGGGSLAVTPPSTAAPGGYGASIIAVSFKGASPEIVQVGLNAVIQAFDEAVANSITSQANAAIAGINKAIEQSPSSSQRGTLLNQETQTLVNEQADLAHTPTAAFGPVTRANGRWKTDGAIGLVVGLMLGAALAYVLALRRRTIADRQDASAIYGVPMIAETPAVQVTNGLPSIISDPRSAAAEAFRFAAGSVERACASRGMPLSLALASPRAGSGRSTVVASLALAMAEGGTRLLVVDAETADGGVTAELLPGIRVTQGFEQVLRGELALADAIQPSPLNDEIAVLGAVPTGSRLVARAARLRAARTLLARAKPSFDIVLIDIPALLEVADAAELADVADAVMLVVNANDRIPDHLEMANWLKSSKSPVVGYLYNRAAKRSRGTHDRHHGSMYGPVREARPNSASVGIAYDDSTQPFQQPQG